MSVGPGAALPFVIWAFVHGNVCLEAVRRMAVRRARGAAAEQTVGRVVVVRACAGAEPRLEESLSSLAPEPGLSLSCVFALGEPGDTARAAADRASGVLGGRGIPSAVLVTHAVGSNHKAAQLEEVTRVIDADVYVFVDSDVALAPGDVRALAQAASSGALAWIPPLEAGRLQTLGDLLSQSVLASSLHAFPFLAELDAGGLVGKCVAVRADVLARMGGFAGLRQCLGEDVELARRARLAGVPVVHLPRVVRSLAERRTTRAVLERLTRWLVVVRLQRPGLLVSYPLLLAATPLLLSFALLPFGSPGDRAVALAAALLGRALLALTSLFHGARPLTALVAAVLPLVADAVLLAALARAATTTDVRWRGRRIPLAALQK